MGTALAAPLGGVLGKFLAAAPTVLLVSGATIAVPLGGANDFDLPLGVSGQLLNPTGTLNDNLILRFWVTQGIGAPFTLTYGALYDFGAAGAPTLSVTAGAMDLIAFQYRTKNSKLNYLGNGLGF